MDQWERRRISLPIDEDGRYKVLTSILSFDFNGVKNRRGPVLNPFDGDDGRFILSDAHYYSYLLIYKVWSRKYPVFVFSQ